MSILWELFVAFARIGLFTFGGGYAMVAIIENVCVEKKAWITHDEMMDITVIAESTPGPIAINCATYVGWKRGGVPGSLAATLGVVLPSFVIIYLISGVLDGFLDIPWVTNAFRGIRVGVGLLIFSVALTMLKKMPKKPLPRIIAGCAFAAMLVINFLALNISTIALMIAAGAVSLGVFLVVNTRKGGDGE